MSQAARHMSWHAGRRTLIRRSAGRTDCPEVHPMTAHPSPIGSRFPSPAPAPILYVAGPRDGQEDVLEVPGGVPTILAVDEPLGYYVAAERLPDGRRRMTWRGFDLEA